MTEIKKILSDEEFAEFLELHQNEIQGLYQDMNNKSDGSKGLKNAINEIEKKYNVCSDNNSIDSFHKLVIEYAFMINAI